MASALGELELEAFGELEHEMEHEFEHELEHEFEHEFEHEMPELFGWGDVSNWARNQWSAVKRPGSWQNSAIRLADRAILAAAPSWRPRHRSAVRSGDPPEAISARRYKIPGWR
jgi:hypothetical protein